MVRLTGIFSRLGSSKVMVIGDLLLDTYTIGKARRISPEAPVAIINVLREENLPGGAGNVMLNLISLGAHVVAIGRVGHDSAGETLRNALSKEGIDIDGIFIQEDYPTPVKNRIIAENQQIVRIDHERVMPLEEEIEKKVIEALPLMMQDVAIVAISDYGKGFLSRKLLNAVISMAKQKGLLIIADPKGIDFTKYVGASIIKPNLGEAYAAANLLMDAPLESVAERVLSITQADTLMITRSEAGISLFHKDGTRDDFPVRVREVKDVTGAGDTVLAMLTCAMANGLHITEAAQLSNVAAGIAIERFGCARVTLSELARRLLEDDVANKVFDGEHLFALLEALRNQHVALLSLSSTRGLTSTIFSTIRKLTKDHQRDLLIYIPESEPDEEFVSLLASLQEVNFILLKSESLQHLCQIIAPEEVVIIQEDQTVRGIHLHELMAILSTKINKPVRLHNFV